MIRQALNRGRFGRAIPLSVLIASLLLVVGPASSQDDPACDYLIVTTEELVPAFEDLAAYRTLVGYTVDLVTLAEILAITDPLEDDAATLRSYLGTRHASSGTEFVLLGGDLELIPARFCREEYLGLDPRDYPVDLYYACYEGNWNADGDSLYAEPEDEPDLFARVAIGRAPVTTLAEAEIFVTKTLAYDQDVSGIRSRALLAAAVMHPYPWQDGDGVIIDGATSTENMAAVLAELPSAVACDRLYQNYTAYEGAAPLSLASLIEALDNGQYGILDLVTHGSYDAIDPGGGYMTDVHVAALSNGQFTPFVFGIYGFLAAFDLEGCFLEQGIVNPDGGFVAGVGTSALSYFTILDRYRDGFLDGLNSADDPRLGKAYLAGQHYLHEFIHINVYAFGLRAVTLLGDPALTLWPDDAVIIEDPDVPEETPLARSLDVEPCYPNPFNPQTTLAYSIGSPAKVSVAVYDLRGRLVRGLVRGEEQVAGRHSVDWNGLDDRDQAVPSGVYLFRVTADEQFRSGRMMLAR